MSSGKTEKKHRNGTIDVIKFISCIFIVMYHFNIYTNTKQYFSGGKFGVEIFCMISGAFFYSKYLKQQDTITTWSYVKTRFLRFFPYTTAAFLMLYAFLHITGRPRALGELADQASGYIWEILLVDMSGINAGEAMLNSPTWTISCLLIVECAIVGLLVCQKKLFFNFIAPISLIVIYGIWSNTESPNYRTWIEIVNFGVLQVWCAVLWGIFAVLAAKSLNRMMRYSIALTIIEWSCYISSGIIMLKRSEDNWRFVLTLFILVALSITLSQKSYSVWLLQDSKITRWLGSMSFSIYLNHSLVLKIFQRIYTPEQMFAKWLFFLVVLFVLSALFNIVINWIVAFSRKTYKAIIQHYLITN